MAWKLSISGILSAFITLVLFLGSIAPTGRIGFQVLASFLMTVIFLETGFRWTAAAWAATSALAFLLLPDKTQFLAWIGFFGMFPMVKNLIERRIRNLAVERVAKGIWFAVCCGAGWGILRMLTPALVPSGWTLWLSLGVAMMIFFLYDELTTRWIHFYFGRISPLLARRRR